MYPLGVLFGLGFDTSSEIALIGISALSATNGTSIWLILIFPILFTAGMCLLDTLDGALMMSLYTSARLGKDAIAVLYYQSVLTAVTVIVAVVIGVLQMLNMVLSVGDYDTDHGFWKGVEVAGDNYDIIGGSICGSFVFFGLVAAVCYNPWRRRVDKKREQLRIEAAIELDEVDERAKFQAHALPEVTDDIAGPSTDAGDKGGILATQKEVSDGGIRSTTLALDS